MKQETPVMLDTISEILPCPFPHELQKLEIVQDFINFSFNSLEAENCVYVLCTICNARGPRSHTGYGAIELWNSAIRPEK